MHEKTLRLFVNDLERLYGELKEEHDEIYHLYFKCKNIDDYLTYPTPSIGLLKQLMESGCFQKMFYWAKNTTTSMKPNTTSFCTYIDTTIEDIDMERQSCIVMRDSYAGFTDIELRYKTLHHYNEFMRLYLSVVNLLEHISCYLFEQ